MINKPLTTLFLLQSLDGKINPGNSGDTENLSQGREFAKIDGLQEGIKQYYDLELETDLHSLNTGLVMKKIGMNRENFKFNIYEEVSFVIIDSKHLNLTGVKNLANGLKKLYIVTTNTNHPAFELKKEHKNIEIIYYDESINFVNLMEELKNEYKIDNITIQSGGTLNSVLLRNNLIDKVSIVIAPVLIGGKDTPTLIDGESITSIDELNKLKVLSLNKVNQLKDSYLHLEYDVLKDAKINNGFEIPN